jgi:hypothetical protein
MLEAPRDPTAAPQGREIGRHRVSGPLARWLRRPEVLADPEQVEGGRIWTRARDVLPGTRIRSERPLIGVWAHAAFEARPEWDDSELGTLWLHKTTDLDVPRPTLAYGTAPAAEAGPATAQSSTDEARAPFTPGAEDLTRVVEDFEECLRLLLADREDIRTVLRTLARGVARLPPAAREAVEGLPGWDEVVVLCHLPTPPWLPPEASHAG